MNYCPNCATLTARVGELEKERDDVKREMERRGQAVADAMGRYRGHESLIEAVARLSSDYHRAEQRAEAAERERDTLVLEVKGLRSELKHLGGKCDRAEETHRMADRYLVEKTRREEMESRAAALVDRLENAIKIAREWPCSCANHYGPGVTEQHHGPDCENAVGKEIADAIRALAGEGSDV